MNEGTDKLEALIRAADASVRQTESQASTARPSRRWKHLPTLVLLAVCALAWGMLFWNSSISNAQIRVDLETLIQSARAQIEARVEMDGLLPAALSDVALRKVVLYEILDADATPPRYQLTAEINGISSSWRSP